MLRPRQNDCHFAGDIFKFMFLYENCILNEIPLLRKDKKPSSDTKKWSHLLTHICSNRPPWFKPISEQTYIFVKLKASICTFLWPNYYKQIALIYIYLAQDGTGITRDFKWISLSGTICMTFKETSLKILILLVVNPNCLGANCLGATALSLNQQWQN